KPAAEKVDDQDYFVLAANPWLAAVGKLTFATALQVAPQKVPDRTKPLALRVHDEQTLIVADEDILKEFLKAHGSFPRAQRQPKPNPEQQQKAAPKAAPADDAGDGVRRRSAARPGAGPAPGAAAQPAEETNKTDEPASATFLTVDPRLKDMMDR